MGVRDIIIYGFAVIGFMLSVWLLIVGGHEYGHVWNVWNQGGYVQEVCLLGYTGGDSYDGVGWIRHETEPYDRNFTIWWDCDSLWGIGTNRTACREYYGE